MAQERGELTGNAKEQMKGQEVVQMEDENENLRTKNIADFSNRNVGVYVDIGK